MHQLLVAMGEFREANDGTWPGSLDDLGPFVGGGEKLAQLTDNPETGFRPGYEYVRPSGSNHLDQRIVLFQVADALRASHLGVAFGDGSIRRPTQNEIYAARQLHQSGLKQDPAVNKAQNGPRVIVFPKTPRGPMRMRPTKTTKE